MNNELYHHGILGQKWGVRRFQNKNGTLTEAGKARYAVESGGKIKVNADGSKTIPKNFKFNRVGKAELDVNAAGGLYVSYGKEDAARYVKALGPTPFRKFIKQAHENVQHIEAKSPLKMPSDERTAAEIAMLLQSNAELLKHFNRSLYSAAVTNDFEKDVDSSYIEMAIKKPSEKEGQKLAWGVCSMLADSNYENEAKQIYKHFRELGYDTMPDLADQLSGTSRTAMIVINPEKIQVTSTAVITKDVMQDAKRYVKSLEKLKCSELIE